MSPLLFFHFNHRHTHWDLSAYSLNESCRADVFISRVSSVPSQLHRRVDECKSMPIDYPFSPHKNCLPQSPIHPLYILSLRMDSSTPIVLCGNTTVAHWGRLCTVVLAILWVKKNWSLHLCALFISNFHPYHSIEMVLNLYGVPLHWISIKSLKCLFFLLKSHCSRGI